MSRNNCKQLLSLLTQHPWPAALHPVHAWPTLSSASTTSAHAPWRLHLFRSISTSHNVAGMERISTGPTGTQSPRPNPRSPEVAAAVAAARSPTPSTNHVAAAASTVTKTGTAEPVQQGGVSAADMQQAAKAGALSVLPCIYYRFAIACIPTASAWMFPWERHQMDGSGSLKWFDKVYWGLFVSAMAVLLFTNLARNTKKEDTEEQKQAKIVREAAKQEQARLLRMGANLIASQADVFEGMTPKEIERYVEQQAPVQHADDPFEGMSPDEINAYVEKHKHLVGQAGA